MLSIALWLCVGVGVGVFEARHGGWHRGWVVSAIFGPFAVPLALQHRCQRRPEPLLLTGGRALHGPVDVLVGLLIPATPAAAVEPTAPSTASSAFG